MAPNTKNKFSISSIFRNQLFIPIAALLLLVIFNLIVDPTFYNLEWRVTNYGDKILYGNLISILSDGSELAILAIGMTLVTAATGGQDISVGAAIAIAGSVILRIFTTTNTPVFIAFIIACVVSMLFGAFNGVLVAVFKIQPMVATLILFTAGRSVARWISLGVNYNVSDPSYRVFGSIIPGVPIPTPFFIAALCVIIIMLVLKFTTLGLYTQSVGINESSSKLNGLNPVFIKILTFVILGICVAVCGLIKTSRVMGINYGTVAKDIEMDAILAVALGGNALSGGKFNMAASILGAYVIQFLTTTLYCRNIPSEAFPAYKAVVVILLVVFSAPTVRDYMGKLGKKIKDKFSSKEVA